MGDDRHGEDVQREMAEFVTLLGIEAEQVVETYDSLVTAGHAPALQLVGYFEVAGLLGSASKFAFVVKPAVGAAFRRPAPAGGRVADEDNREVGRVGMTVQVPHELLRHSVSGLEDEPAGQVAVADDDGASPSAGRMVVSRWWYLSAATRHAIASPRISWVPYRAQLVIAAYDHGLAGPTPR